MAGCTVGTEAYATQHADGCLESQVDTNWFEAAISGQTAAPENVSFTHQLCMHLSRHMKTNRTWKKHPLKARLCALLHAMLHGMMDPDHEQLMESYKNT